MNHFLRKFLISFSLIVFGLLVGFKIENFFSTDAKKDIDKGVKKLEQALAFIERNYVKDPNHEELVDNAIKGVLGNLDPHSFYISASEMQVREEEMSGSFEGIGIEYSMIDDTLYIVAPLAGSPSEKAGLKAGDKLIRVDDQNMTGKNITTDLIAQRLKGEKGSKVKVSVKRYGIDKIIDFTVTRDKIPLYSVDYSYMITPEIGYIRIEHFSETTYEEFLSHIRKLKEDGMQNLILDLRGNPGGYLMMAKNIADDFLPSGKKIVSTSGRTSESQQEYYSTASLDEFEQGGLVVLMDYGSASASEILAGAIQDHDRGLIVGVRSYGKGLVQIQKKFDDGSAMRIVVSEYYTPSGRCIQKPYSGSHEQYEHEIEDRFENGEIYDPSKVVFPDSLKFQTDAGRIVYGGGGIFPDVFVANDTSFNSEYLAKLLANDMFKRFAYDYVDKNPALKMLYPHAARFVYEFKADSDLLHKFVKFAETKGVVFTEEGYEHSKNNIQTELKACFGKRLFQDEAYYPSLHEGDNVIQKALDLMPAAAQLQRTGKFTVR